MTIREGTERTGVLVLSGPLELDRGGRGAADLHGAIERLLRCGLRDITLDVREVPSLTAAGLGEVILAFTTVRKAGAGLSLFGPNARLRRMLAITRVDTVIPICPTLEPPARTATVAASVAPAQPARCDSDRGWTSLAVDLWAG